MSWPNEDSATMLRPTVAVCSILLLAACGEAPMGASEGASSAPADAPATAPPGPDFSGDFNLVGTEPFWGGKIRADGLSLSRPDQSEVTAANTGVKVEDDVGAWGVGHMVIKLTPEACSDGMSDRKYAYRAEATLNGEVLKGCADRPAALAAQQP
ncbi:COG3650 family protein [Caulobacter sp. DWR2-3-1b2]|uniref:COG3650 family protein n=1 Tax=unclassified Caulobacter TaxID=2648921 RepID=UPI003CEA7E0B